MRTSRDAVIAKQYNTVEAARRYADGYHDGGPEERFYRSRIELVFQVLTTMPGGDLLDVGCGPGMMVRELLGRRAGDFRITAVDQSEAMVQACLERAGASPAVRGVVGRAECLPLATTSFDVVLAMGVLEYCEISHALSEIARVARPGGLVLLSMLNPVSPYRFVEWHIYPAAKRVLRTAETAVGITSHIRHGPTENGIQAFRPGTFRRMVDAAGLDVVDAPAFDINYVVPPMDRIVRRRLRGWQSHPERTISRDWRRRFGSAYALVARKPPT